MAWKQRAKDIFRFKRLTGAVAAAMLLVLYVLSYCCILPLGEAMGKQSFFYGLYEPVEFLRYRSDMVWWFTESGYRLFWGKSKPEMRYLLGTPRRGILWYDNGQMSFQASYRKGKLDGTLLDFWDNGQIRVISSQRDGDYNGTVKQFDRLGNLVSLSTYRRGVLDGPYRLYYPAGTTICEQCDYADGKGVLTTYLRNGNRVAECLFNGRKPVTGTFLEFRERDTLEDPVLVEYRNGELVGRKDLQK